MMPIERSKGSALSTFPLESAPDVNWDLSLLVKDIADWMNEPIVLSKGTAGALSLPQVVELVEPSSRCSVVLDFQRMVYAVSLAYTQYVKQHLSMREIHGIGCIAGHQFLEILDQRLKPQSLNECSGPELRALFIMVLGPLLSVAYAQPLVRV